MKIIKLLALILLLIPLSIKAESDKYRLVLTADPATTITIGWNQISGNNPTVRYGTIDQGQNASAYQLSHTPDRVESFRGMNNNFARITGLQPNTYYYFVIEDSDNISERFYFKTAPSDRSRLSFVAGGDSRNNREPRLKANKLVSKLKPNAVFFGGDMTSSDNSSQWQQWFDDWQETIAPDGRMFPIIPAQGNHEASQTVYRLFDTLREDSYGAVTFGDDFFRIYTLNTEISVFGNQRSWLENDLNSHASAVYRSAQYHKPMRPHTLFKSEGTDIYNAWSDLFYDNAVKLVVDSDSHTVKTTFPVKPSSGPNSDEGFEVDTEFGTTYVGEGCWGAPLRDNNDDKDWTRDSGSFNQVKLIFVDEEKIELRTINVENADSVTPVSNENPFTIPANLDIWTMQDGEEITYIYPTQVLQPAEIQFSSAMPSNYQSATGIQISIDVLNEGNGIANIEYKARSLRTGTIINLGSTTSQPHTITIDLPENGQYELIATATTSDNLTQQTFKTIVVGDFQSTIALSINQGSNDIEEGQNNSGALYMDSPDLELGYDFTNDQDYQKVGLRFEDIFIPQGAQITSARIVFTADEGNSTPAQSTIYVEDEINSSSFESSNYNLTQRNFLQQSITWDIEPWATNDQGENTTTPELILLLQSIVDKPDWQSGNAVSFMFNPTGPSLENSNNKRVAEAYEGEQENAPQLVYTFTYNQNTNPIGSAEVLPGIGINTETPSTPLDVNGLMRSSLRNEDGEIYECTETIEGAMGYDKENNSLNICVEENGEFVWKTIDLK